MYIDLRNLFILMLVICAGCTRKVNTFEIGVSQCSQDEWREKQNREMLLESSFYNNINLEILSVNDDNQKQISDIQCFIEKKKDLIVVSPNEASAITPIVEKAYDAGIPVIVIDRKINSEKYTAFIGADNYKIGQMIGEYVKMLSLNGGSFNLFEINGLWGSTPAIERSQGFHSEISDIPNIRLVGKIEGNWRMEVAQSQMDSVFSVHPDINLVISQNDRMAIGAYKAAVKHGLQDKIIFTGVDALTDDGMGVDEVINGHLAATFIYPTAGDKVIQTAMAILEGEHYEKEITLSSEVVDIRNARIMMLQDIAVNDKAKKLSELSEKVDVYFQQYNAQKLLTLSLIIIIALLMILSVIIVTKYWQTSESNHILEETVKAKLDFFTNVSHDFRTPLTLMRDPVERLLASPNLDIQERRLVSILNKNLVILLRLVNQTLDFRKYEEGKLHMTLTEFNILDEISSWIEPFTILAKRKQIKFEFNLQGCNSSDDYDVVADEEKCERIIYNLLSNAVKFTSENGTITLSLENYVTDGSRWIRIVVSDTGIGMEQEQLNHIFDSFYQVHANYSGSGIGLALVKAFVRLHGGTVSVKSQTGKGSVFYVDFPAVQNGVLEGETDSKSADQVTVDGAIYAAEQSYDVKMSFDDVDENLPTVLIIDDNGDVRSLIHRLLKGSYNILEANNGKEGLGAAMKYIPDIILCDMMMPVMDGLEFCRNAKNELSTSHIPIVIVTANTAEEQQVKGYESGADGYISKPFSESLLKSVIFSLLDNRNRCREYYSLLATSASHVSFNNQDTTFIDRVSKIIEEHISDENLSIDFLSEQLHLSRTQVYRKVKALTGYSPVELVKMVRMKKASYLLTTTEMSISEIAYQLGFSTPSYFTRVYKEFWGETPLSTRERI